MAKRIAKLGVSLFSVAILGMAPVLSEAPFLAGAQVVHAEDGPIVEKGYGALFYVDEGNGPYFVGAKRMSAPPVAENHYGDFSNITNITVELDPEYTAKVNAERPDKDWEWYKVIFYISNSATPKDTDTDPANGGNADTGGGNNAGGDTQTPPVDDNGGETGSQDQTPPVDNTGDTGTDTSTSPVDTPKPQILTVVETRQDENGDVLFTKTHSLVLNPGEEKDLGYNPDREVLVRGGNIYRYGNFEEGVTIYFTTRLKPVATDVGAPADGGNADTGGGNNAGGDTQTPPVDDNGGETGSQDQTPPVDNTGDTGTDTSTSPVDTPKPQILTVVETRQDEKVSAVSQPAAGNTKVLPSTGEGSSILSLLGVIAFVSGLGLSRRKKGIE